MKSIWGVRLLTLILTTSISSTAALSQGKPSRDSIFMGSVESLNQKGEGATAAGFRDARSEDWPASFYTIFEDKSCSSTLVGPRALLLAAQCVSYNRDIIIEFRGTRISGSCRRAEAYDAGSSDMSADYALCLLRTQVSGIPFETVNVHPSLVRKGSEVILTGPGCKGGRGMLSSGGGDRFHLGATRVVALPGERPNELNTIVTGGGAVLCPGAGGGGAFIQLPGKGRRLAAVNSRVNYAVGESYLSSLSSAEARAFLQKWTMDTGAEICGINLGGSSCR